MKNYLKEEKRVQMNPYYNPRFSNNGGGYSQPHYEFIGIFNDKPVKVSVRDTSCGDFGERYCIEVVQGDKKWYCYFNDVENDVIDESTMTQDVVDFLDEYLPLHYDIRVAG
jgi:hypothetical protein